MRDFIDTHQVNLKAILEDESIYVIPRFQREYSWEDEHIGEFWKDLTDSFKAGNAEPYFFGTFVFIQTTQTEKYKVVDGQQRLSTSITLLSVIRDFLFEFNKERDVENIQHYIETDEISAGKKEFRLEMSRNNQDFFLAKILTIGKASEKDNIVYDNISKRNKGLATAYHFFYVKIKEELKGIPEKDKMIEYLVRISNHFLKYFVVVKNIIDTPERAYRIFDTINNRGIGLNESDLVKNYLLEQIDHAGGDIDFWYNKWLAMLTVLDNAHVKESDFLRHYLMAHYRPTGPKDVFDTVLDAIKDDKQAEDFIDKIHTSSKTYRKLKDPEKTDWFGDKDIVESLQAFNSLNAKVIYPVLLKGVDVFNTNPKAFSSFIQCILIFFFRSRTICKTNASSLETLMNSICLEMRETTALTIHDIEKKLKKSSEYPTDEQFKFDFTRFDANAKNSFYILKNLNIELHGGVKSMTLSTDKDNVSVEHIMPKIITKSEWEIYLNNKKGFKNKTELDDYHKNNLWKIGNLTMLNRTKNSSAQNNSFMKKCEEIYKNDDAKIVNHLLTWKEWNAEAIFARQQILADVALKIWKISD